MMNQKRLDLNWEKTSHVRNGKKYVGLETDTKKCGNCKKVLPLIFYYSNGSHRPDGACYLKHICKECKDHHTTESRRSKKNAPYEKTEECECCHNKENKIEGDHIHGTTHFRGWICSQCNQGIGKLGDDLDGVLRAAKYLVKGNIDILIDKLTGVVRDTSNDPFKGTNMEGKD
jgi:hypothetical protein